jgi:CRISPR-associated protein Cmr4
MIKFTAHAYLIECLSNLHVGSGDNNYGVIDKQVQRDAISKQPIIHGSGLKGALREYFKECIPQEETNITAIFGSDKNEQAMQQGNYRFMEARLLALPLRGLGTEPYYIASTPAIIAQFNKLAKELQSEIVIAYNSTDETGETEFGELPLHNIPGTGISSIAMADEQTMNEALKNLPIIARNSLDNGQSENLWYEEIVPRESRFYFFVLVPDNAPVDFEKNFNTHLNDKITQIGANATVGYGYCKITKLIQNEQVN